ncbi:unnamed protein product [Lota lota]
MGSREEDDGDQSNGSCASRPTVSRSDIAAALPERGGKEPDCNGGSDRGDFPQSHNQPIQMGLTERHSIPIGAPNCGSKGSAISHITPNPSGTL